MKFPAPIAISGLRFLIFVVCLVSIAVNPQTVASSSDTRGLVPHFLRKVRSTIEGGVVSARSAPIFKHRGGVHKGNRRSSSCTNGISNINHTSRSELGDNSTVLCTSLSIASLLREYPDKVVHVRCPLHPQCSVLLCGTVHVSAASARMVRRVMQTAQPDYVVVELCPERAPSVLQQELRWRQRHRHRHRQRSSGEGKERSCGGEEFGCRGDSGNNISAYNDSCSNYSGSNAASSRVPHTDGMEREDEVDVSIVDEDMQEQEEAVSLRAALSRGWSERSWRAAAAGLLHWVQQQAAQSAQAPLGGELLTAVLAAREVRPGDRGRAAAAGMQPPRPEGGCGLHRATASSAGDGGDDSIYARQVQTRGVPVILGDRLYSVTIQRLMDRLTAWEKAKAALCMLAEVVVTKCAAALSMSTMGRFLARADGEQQFVQDELEQLAAAFPSLADVLIAERDEYLACTIHSVAQLSGGGSDCGDGTATAEPPLPREAVGAGPTGHAASTEGTTNSGRRDISSTNTSSNAIVQDAMSLPLAPTVVVAVIGAGHLRGVAAHLRRDCRDVSLGRLHSISSSSATRAQQGQAGEPAGGGDTELGDAGFGSTWLGGGRFRVLLPPL